MPDVTFSKDTLYSPIQLHHFLQGTDSIREVLSRKGTLIGSNQTEPNSWTVVWLTVTQPLTRIYSLFSKAVGSLYLSLGYSTGHAWMIQSYHLDNRTNAVFNHFAFKENFLIGCRNIPAQNTSDIYAHNPIDVLRLPVEVQNLIKTSNKTLHFDEYSEGNCRGISDWFAYTYFQTKKHFHDHKSHAIAVASLFEKGAPKEAQLLQTAFLDNATCLGIEQNIMKARLIFKKDHKSTQAYLDKITSATRSLKPGLYAIGLPRHRINLIKGSTDSYLHDPNTGLVAMSSLKDTAHLWATLHDRYTMGYVNFTEIKKVEALSTTSAA
ncbi:MAG: hypothetical protein KGZ30_01935 [Anaplasmataceae bacterium]|nr:hypothetical protein [Anaplasmataceae bacterium]